jgi:phosphatidylethanolamine-binding protein (PEBP) family uncharacterized protein
MPIRITTLLRQHGRLGIVIIFFTLVFTACGRDDPNITELNVTFQWNPPCAPLDRSPQITVDRIPAGTVRWYVAMTDLHLPAFDHGSGFAPLGDGGIIPAGAVKGSYNGPSPPYGVFHDYEILVMARDAQNRTIGRGKYALRYPPEEEKKVRWLPCD